MVQDGDEIVRQATDERAARPVLPSRPQPALCPHCYRSLLDGFGLKAGIYGYDHAGGFTVRGVPLGTSRPFGDLLGLLMSERGAIVDDGRLAAFIGSAAGNKGGLIAVRMSRLRAELEALDAGWPVSRRYAKGWYWNGPAVEDA